MHHAVIIFSLNSQQVAYIHFLQAKNNGICIFLAMLSFYTNPLTLPPSPCLSCPYHLFFILGQVLIHFSIFTFSTAPTLTLLLLLLLSLTSTVTTARMDLGGSTKSTCTSLSSFQGLINGKSRRISFCPSVQQHVSRAS